MSDPLTPYPLTGFRFMVHFLGLELPVDMAFQEVSGLEMNVETELMREGGEYAFSYRLPLRISQPELVLKRGLTTQSLLTAWVLDALENFNFTPLLVTIILLNEKQLPVMTWEATQAWPVGWSLSPFNAQANEVVIETLKLAYAHLRRLL